MAKLVLALVMIIGALFVSACGSEGNEQAVQQPNRFVDNADGTVTDTVTSLMWEKKTGTPMEHCTSALVCYTVVDCSLIPCDDPHDVNNGYTWSAQVPGGGTLPDGSAFTDFLERVNGTLCSAPDCIALGGHTDWQLPTIAELQTIIDPTCKSGGPCLDKVFGPVGIFTGFWSSTTNADNPRYAWGVGFLYGDVGGSFKSSPAYVRAVRVVDPVSQP